MSICHIFYSIVLLAVLETVVFAQAHSSTEIKSAKEHKIQWNERFSHSAFAEFNIGAGQSHEFVPMTESANGIAGLDVVKGTNNSTKYLSWYFSCAYTGNAPLKIYPTMFSGQLKYPSGGGNAIKTAPKWEAFGDLHHTKKRIQIYWMRHWEEKNGINVEGGGIDRKS